MADLTTAELAYIRAKLGDYCVPELADDAKLQEYYDLPHVQEADNPVAAVIVEALENRWGKTKPAVLNLATGGQAYSTAEMRNIEKMIDYWSRIAGIRGARALVGVIEYNFSGDDGDEWAV